MKKATLTLVLLALAIAIFPQKDKKATEILDAAVEVIESYTTAEFDFTSVMINEGAGVNETQNGVLVVKGNKFHLTIEGQIVISDGETLWTYLPDDEEVMINEVEEGDENLTPHTLLNAYQEKYKSKFVKEDKIKGKLVEVIELTPLEKGKSYSKVRITVDKASKAIQNFSIYDKNGSTYSYYINNLVPNVEVTDETFSFDPEKHPDVEVVDMR